MVYSIFKEIKEKNLFSSDQLAKFIEILNEYLQDIRINQNNEENLKNDLKKLLSNFFPNHISNKPFSLENISAKDIDLAIFNKSEKTENDFIKVLFETKKPNAFEMITKLDLNRKALHEAILYFFIEKEIEHNHKIEYIIITDFVHWFLINSEDFRKTFYTKKELLKDFKGYTSGNGNGTTSTTEWFYNQCKSFLADVKNSRILSTLKYTYIDLSDLNSIDDSILAYDFQSISGYTVKDFLITFFYILSPAFMLNKAETYRNANRLNQTFYNFLLNIIGVKEKPSEKKQRSEIKIILDDENTDGLIHKIIKKIKRDHLDKTDEQIFDASLGLCLNWINRLLFIKLLEAYLIKINSPSTDEIQNYYIIYKEKIKDFEDFDTLFFEVLANESHSNPVFINVPFLNSSLFDRSPLERSYHISLGDFHDYDVTHSDLLRVYTKLYNKKVKTSKFIPLLLDFLNFFDFGSGKKIEVTEILINTSVLGLIFEKINGYKEASYYTPSQVTEFICENTIQSAVLKKINEFLEEKGIQKQKSLDYVKDIIEKKRWEDKEFVLELNNRIDSLKICDPAVGSGHFLVSALNELLKVKCDLSLTFNKNNEYISIFCKYDEYRELEFFKDKDFRTKIKYRKQNGSYDYQREQETIFHIKKVILENCLYGVDINPNSIFIARLRLWIELIKNAFYNDEVKMETLPNIDINIRSGDSLFNRIPFDFKITEGYEDLEEIKQLIVQYKEERDLKTKIQISDKMSNFKKKLFRDNKNRVIKGIKKNISELKKQRKTRQLKITAPDEDKEEWEKEKKRLTEVIKVHTAKIKELEKIDYESFEWKYEFPNLLDEEFNFMGFDVIILNPPYISFSSTKKIKKMYNTDMIKILKANFDYKIKRKKEKGKKDQFINDLYEAFLLRSIQLAKLGGYIGIITSDTFCTIDSYESLRLNLLEELPGKFLIWKPCPVDAFENDNPLSPLVSTSIFIIEKSKSSDYEFTVYDRPKTLDFFNSCEEYSVQISNFKNSIRKSFWIPNPQNVEIYEKIIKGPTEPPFYKFKPLIQASTRVDLTEKDPNNPKKTRNNNSEYLAVLDSDQKYSEMAKKYRKKYEDKGEDIVQLSKDAKLRGAVWKIITEDDIIKIEDLTDDQKLNGTDHKWIPMVKGSGVAAIEKNLRYYNEMHYYVDWDKDSIKNYSQVKKKFFWKQGIYFSLATASKQSSFMLDETSRLKGALKVPGPNDVNFTAIILNREDLTKYLLGIMNTKFIFKIKLAFINHTTATQKIDLQQIPIREPEPDQKSYIEERVDKCIEIQKNSLASIQFNGKEYTLEELEREIEEKTLEIYNVNSALFI